MADESTFPSLRFRAAIAADLPAVVRLPADDAFRFYGRLGFAASHEGLKLDLS